MKRTLLAGISLMIILTGLQFTVSRADDTPPTASYPQGSYVRVDFNIPFSWLRQTPSSADSRIVDTALRGEKLFVLDPTPTLDGSQWWWKVVRYSAMSNYATKAGWVEQDSILPTDALPQAAPLSSVANWDQYPGGRLEIVAGIAFVWVRFSPSSYSEPILTLRPGTPLYVATGGNIDRQWDGVQWWWPVTEVATRTFGWVEQKSLRLVR